MTAGVDVANAAVIETNKRKFETRTWVISLDPNPGRINGKGTTSSMKKDGSGCFHYGELLIASS